MMMIGIKGAQVGGNTKDRGGKIEGSKSRGNCV